MISINFHDIIWYLQVKTESEREMEQLTVCLITTHTIVIQYVLINIIYENMLD